MATRKLNAQEAEKMTDANILRVIGLLEPKEQGVQPITKKLACELLGMTYNTTRLGTIIQQFREKRERERKRRAEKRGTPATQDEIQYSIECYLKGETIDGISNALYRSPEFVKQILRSHSVPIRAPSHDYFKPELIPEGAIQERFGAGEIVYSARYDSMAKIEAELKQDPNHGWVYRIWLLSDRWHQYAYQPASELASLQHLRELGVRI